MVTVLIDGKPFAAPLGAVNSMTDLIELIRASIDPDTMITSVLLGGKELGDVDWRVPLSVHGTQVLEVTTGSRERYLADRFASSVDYVDHIKEEFAFARSCYEEGKNADANNAMIAAVNDLNAFLNWYNTLLSLAPGDLEQQLSLFRDQVTAISRTCEQMLQQQMYNSWWAIGETMKNELEPKLMTLKDACGDFAQSWQ